MVGEYSFESRPVTLAETKSYTFGQDGYGSGQALQNKTLYFYHLIHKTFPATVVSQVGSGPQEKTTFRYPVDLIGSTSEPASPDIRAAGVWKLFSGNIITPIEKISWIKNTGDSNFKIIGAELKTFKKNATLGTPMAYEDYSLPLSDPITALSSEAGLTSSGTVFSFDGRYLKRNEYTFTESSATLTSALSSDGITTNYEYLNNALVSATIVNPGATQMRQENTYNTILGLTQSKDVNGRNSKIEYEFNLGRVKLLRDHDNNIMKRYRYHVQGESLQLPNGTLTLGGCAMINSATDFAAYITTEYGVTSYEWDFGDGSVTTTTTGNVSHTYTTQGFFTVKVKRSNPEYLGVTTSEMSVMITSPVTLATVCVDGVIAYDICDIQPDTFGECEIGVESIVMPMIGGGGITLPYIRVIPNGYVTSYQWQYRVDSGSWNSFGASTATVQGPPPYDDGVPGMYSVRCILTDNCGNNFISDTFYLSCYASTSCQ